MRTIGLFEAKQKLSELVERASEGESIGITRRGNSPPSLFLPVPMLLLPMFSMTLNVFGSVHAFPSASPSNN